MKKHIVIIGLIVGLMIILCSCDDHNSGAEGTIYPSLNTDESNGAEVKTSNTISNYDVNSYSIDYGYDDVMIVAQTVVEELNNENNQYTIQYISDYSEFLNGNSGTSNSCPPEEMEYHLLRRFRIVELNICFFEYESAAWAELKFRSLADNYIYSDCFYNYCNEGYYFINDADSIYGFLAVYLIDDCVYMFGYDYNGNNQEHYQIYLDICEELGLPTCDEVTEDIMGISN